MDELEQCSETLKKIRICRRMDDVKKDILAYLDWCEISGLKPNNAKSLNLYIELTTLIMEQIDDSLQNTHVAE